LTCHWYIFFKEEYLLRKAWKPLVIFCIAALSLFFIFEEKDMAQGKGIGDEQLLARAVNGEARGESYEGQVAVAAVIINRTRAPEFPKTIAGVIYQPGAFTAVSDGQINVPIDEDSTVVKAARDALNGWDPTNGCLYYWNPATATSKWIWSRTIVKKIGKHNFGK
jgi:N-acetylmuramoyl-L-alanine amidase